MDASHDCSPDSGLNIIEAACIIPSGKAASPALIQGSLAFALSKYLNDSKIVLGLRQVDDAAPLASNPSAVKPITVEVDLADTISQYLNAFQPKDDETNTSTALSPSDYHVVLVVHSGSDNGDRQRQILRASSALFMPTSRMDIHYWSNGKEIQFLAHFDASKASRSQVQHILDSYQEVLREFHTIPDSQLLSTIRYTPAEHINSIQKMNDVLPKAEEALIGERIRQQVLQRPDAPALCPWDIDAEISYRDLDVLTTKLAQELIRRRSTREEFIAFCFEKSAWAIVSILAILKAGSGFVFIDPSQPRSRTEAIINASKATTLLASPQYAQHLTDVFNEVIIVDEASISALPKRDSIPLPSILPNDAAYIINTSGSTGVPKSIVIEHSALSTAITSMMPLADFSSTSRVLQYSAFTFDIHINEIFTTLAYGGCICMPSEEERMGDVAVPINRMNVTVADLTPRVAQLLNPEDVPSLRYLISSGESCNASLIAQWANDVSLSNAYGPSECTVTCSFRVGLNTNTHPNNIGRANAARLWVVDPTNHDVLSPIGAVGELLVEGPLLARGYTNPEQTAKSFIRDPAWAASGGRFYKTGDLVRYTDDGSLLFIGRKDSQIKLNGRRIELGEIEHAISVCSQVDVAVVQFLPDGIYGQQLVAVVVLESAIPSQAVPGPIECIDDVDLNQAANKIAQLKQQLKGTLSAHLIPNTWLAVKSIPVNNNGKSDRKAVKAYLESRDVYVNHADATKAVALPEAQYHQKEEAIEGNTHIHTGSEETKLQMLYAEALNVPIAMIQPQSNFFELGGTSLKAMKLGFIARREQLPITVPLLLKFPVLQDLASQLRQDTSTAKSTTTLQDKRILPFELVGGKEAAQDILNAHSYLHDIHWSTVADMYPCTPLQAGLLALSAYNPGTYTSQYVFRMRDDIDVSRFCSAWKRCVEETEILRAMIVPSDDHGPCQVILAADDKRRWITNQTQHQSLDAFLSEDAKQHISYGNLLNRFAMVEDSRYFVWTTHHAAYDGFSIALVLRKVQQLYDGAEVQPTVSVARLVKYISDLDHEKSKQFWESYLENTSTVHYPRMTSSSSSGQAALPDAEQQVTMKLESSSLSSSDITISTIIRAAWGLVISRYSESDDVVFGTTMSGRTVPVQDIEHMSGPTITTVPVRVQVTVKQNVKQWLRRIQDDSAAMMEFDHVGIPSIASYGPGCKAASSFNNLIIVQPEGISDVTLLDMPAILDKEGILKEEQTYPLNVEVTMMKDGLRIRVNHNTEAIPETQALRMMHHLSQAIRELSAAAGDASKTIRDISLVSPQDLEEIRSWNQVVPPAFDTTIVEQFLLRAKEHPDDPAVCAWEGNLTYAEVDHLSLALAQHLASLGVGEGMIVPFCFNKSLWAVIATLAIMRTGAAFVAVDPEHPQSRVSAIIAKCKATIMVTTPQHASKFASQALQVVQVSDSFCRSLTSTLNLGTIKLPIVSPRSCAFILFTSGSTGNPKGIVIEHQAVCTSTNAYGTKWKIGRGTRMFQFASYVFDVSVSDMFTSLTRGACVCVPSDHDRMNNIASAINSLNANFVSLTPTVAALLHPDDVPGLKGMVLGGEGPTLENVRLWSDKIDLFLCYGPAECAITCSSTEKCNPGSDPSNLGLPLGANILLVDPEDHNKLVPVGCVGEILIGGPVLARCYLDEPDKVQAAFVKNPTFIEGWTDKNHCRFYKTGDLGFYDPRRDGSISFAGRKDNQVKVRGQRIELGEVEFHMYASPELHHAVAAVPSAGPFKGRLVALLTLASESADLAKPARTADDVEIETRFPEQQVSSALTSLKKHLADKLPQYMIPSSFIVLKSIPLNTSGKLNRKEIKTWLETLDGDRYQHISQSSEVKQRRPLTKTEEMLRQVYCDVLKLDAASVQLHQSFLALGGDSIMAMLVVSRCQAEGIKATVRDILQSGSLEELATKVVSKEEEIAKEVSSPECDTPLLSPQPPTPASPSLTSTSSLPADDIDIWDAAMAHLGLTTSNTIEAVYPCTSVQSGMLLAHSRDPRFYAISNVFEVKSRRPGQAVDSQRLGNAWKQVVKRQPVLRSVFFESPWSPETAFHQAVLKDWKGNVTHTQSEEDDPSGALFNQRTLDFARHHEPPNKLTICTTPTGRVFAKVDILHTLSDGTTWDLIFKEVNQAYEGNLPSTPAVSYAGYVAFLVSKRTSSVLDYWTSYLSGLKPCLFPKSAIASTKAAARMVDVEFGRTREIKAFCTANGITVSNFVQAAWASILRMYTGNDDVCFGYVVSGRDAAFPGIESAIGTFIGQLPARVRVNTDDELLQVAKTLQTDYFSAFERQHVSLMELQHKLGVNGPLFNTNIHYMRSEDSDSHLFSTLQFEYVQSMDPSEYSITVHAMASDDNITFHLGYWDSEITDVDAHKLKDVFSSVMSDFLANAHSRVGTLQHGLPALNFAPKSQPNLSYNAAQPTSSTTMRQNWTAREMTIREAWSDILQVEPTSIGLSDVFRSLGGDSYLTMLLIRQLRQSGLDLSYADALSGMSLRQMAAAVQESAAAAENTKDVKPLIVTQADSDQKRVGPVSPFAVDYAGLLLQTTPGDYPTAFPLKRHSVQDLALIPTGTIQFYPAEAVVDLQPATRIQHKILASHVRCERFYNSRLIWKIPASMSNISAAKFQAAWQQVVDSHRILRTVFVMDKTEDTYSQLVLASVQPTFGHFTVKDEYEGLQLLAEESPVACMTMQPAHRVSVCSTTDGLSLFSFTASHALSDAVSLGILIEALSLLCSGNGDDISIIELHPFRDLAATLLRSLRNEGEAYWAAYLQDKESSKTAFSLSQRTAGKPAKIVMSFNDVQTLRRLSAASGITASTIFRLAWAKLLRDWTGENCVWFEYVVSGRDAMQPGIDKMVGPVLNILPCRVELASATTTRDMLQAVQADFFESLEHHLCLPNRDSRFNTLVNFRNNNILQQKDSREAEFQVVWAEDPMEYDIVLVVNEWPDKFDVELNYWSDGLSPAVVTKLGNTLLELVKGMVA